MITLFGGAISCRVGVVCVEVAGSRWTIFFYIVLWRGCCGILFSIHLVYNGCYLKRVVDLLGGWWNMLGRHTSNIWNLVPSCLMWTLWHERNQHTFEEVKSENQVLDCFTTTFFEWSRAWGFTSGITVLHFISSLSLIPCTTHYVIT